MRIEPTALRCNILFVDERASCGVVWNVAVVRTLAGGLNGTVASFSDGTGSLAGFNMPYGVAVDASGNTYVADRFNHRVRKVTPGGGASMFLFVDR
jgi:hypothetical protein